MITKTGENDPNLIIIPGSSLWQNAKLLEAYAKTKNHYIPAWSKFPSYESQIGSEEQLKFGLLDQAISSPLDNKHLRPYGRARFFVNEEGLLISPFYLIDENDSRFCDGVRDSINDGMRRQMEIMREDFIDFLLETKTDE